MPISFEKEQRRAMPGNATSQHRTTAWIILGLLALAYLFIPFHRSCLSILSLDIMRDLELGTTAFSMLSAAFFLAYGVMQIPAGILNDTLGPRKILPYFMLLAGLGALCMGLGDTMAMMLVGRALTGVGISVIYLSTVKIVANWFPLEKFAAINGVFVSTGGIGMILASGPLAYLAQWAGWRLSLISAAVVCLALALLMRLYVYDAPGHHAQKTDTPESIRTPFHAVMQNMPHILNNKNFWALCLWTFCQFTIGSGFGGLWGGAYLVHVHGLSQSAAGNVLNMMGVGLFAGAAGLGWLAGHVFRSCKLLMVICSLVSVILYVLLALFGGRFPTWALYAWFFLHLAFGIGPVFLAFVASRALFNASLASTVAGLLNTLPAFGVVMVQPLTGFILASYRGTGGIVPEIGYSMVCLPFIIVGMIAAGAILFLREKNDRKIPF